MEIDLRRLDTEQLNIMLERANEQLRSALVNGEPWEEVEKKSQVVTEIAFQLHRNKFPSENSTPSDTALR